MAEERGWWVVIPLKGTALSKSRLARSWQGDVRELATAFALDVLDAVTAATTVAGAVVVTTSDEERVLRGRLDPERSARMRFVADPERGLNAAIEEGVRRVRSSGPHPVAALLADLPGLTSAELDEALLRGADAPASFLPDADGSGTTLVTAGRGIAFRSAFGEDSARRHRELGLEEIEYESPGIRRDADTVEDLLELQREGLLGRHSAALLPGG